MAANLTQMNMDNINEAALKGNACRQEAHLEEGIWLVGGLFHSLKQGKMTPLVVFYVLPYLGQQHQRKEPLSLQMEQSKK